MRAEKALYYILSHDSGVLALVGGGTGRIFSGLLPQNKAWPAISMHLISATRRPPIRAGIGQSLVDARVQVTAYAQTYPDVKALNEAVRLALDRISGTYAGTVVVVSLLDLEGPDDYDADNQIFYQPQDFMVTHYE